MAMLDGTVNLLGSTPMFRLSGTGMRYFVSRRSVRLHQLDISRDA